MHPRPHEVLHIAHLVRIPYQAVSGEILRRLAASGFDDVRPSHLVVFQHIRKEGSRLSELAELAQMTPQSMGYLVDQLEARGYLERRPDPGDRRAVLVVLTARGWAEVRCALDAIAELEDEWRTALGAHRFAELERALADLAALLAPKGYV